MNKSCVTFLGAVVAAAAFCMNPATAGEYYLNPAGGSMSNLGTESSPWPSLQTVAASGRQFAAGDVLILMAGHHGSPNLANANAGYVTVRPQTGARATLRQLSFASSARFWHVRDLEISPETSSSYGRVALIEMSGSCDNIVEGCQAYSVKDSTRWSATDWRTITCDALNASGSRNTIRSNTFRNVYWGIQVGGDHNLIQRNTVDRFAGDGLRGNGNYLTFEYNLVKNHFTVDDNHPDGFQAWTTGTGGVGTGVLRGNILRGNVIIECDDPALPFRGGLEGIGCFDGFYEDWVVENNVIVVDTWHGIAFYGARNCKFINNTVVDINRTGAGPAWLMVTAHKNGTPSTGNLVRNNLTSDLAIDTGAATVDHNLKTTAYETHFVNWAGQNLRLRAGSPAIDAGSSNQVPAADALGVVRPIDGNGDGLAAWDLGAYEYVSGAPTVSLTAPANGATYTAPASVAIQATAADADGTIAKVEFFNGATKLGEDTTSPYAYTWSSVVAGAYTLTAKATDNSGASTTSAGVNITVTSSSVNQPPVANAQSVTTAVGTAKAITLTGSDPEGSALTYAIVANPAHGTLTGTGASRTYTPAANYSGADSFTFKVNDGALDSAPAIVSITVTIGAALPFPLGWDDPIFANTVTDSDGFLSVTQGGTYSDITLDKGTSPGSCLDVYQDCTVTRVRINGREGIRGANGDVNVSWAYVVAKGIGDDHADAWQNYAPGVGPNDSTITLKNSHLRCPVKDGEPGNAAFFTANEWMGHVVLEDVYLSGGGYTLRIHGDGATSMSLKNVYIEENSWVFGPTSFPEVNGKRPTIVRWENVRLATIVNGQLVLGALITQPYGTVTSPPTVALTAPANGATVTAPASITLQATAADADGTIARVEFFNGATKLGEDTTSPYAYTWSSVSAGSYTLTAKATDNSGASTISAGVNITVTSSSVNQPPVANAQSVSTVAGTAKVITLTGSDPEGSNLTYTVVSNPVHGTLTGTGASRTYTPAANYSGADSFTFKVNDGALDSTPATVSINVTGGGLPSPWVTSDIGSVGIAGSATESGGVYTVQGSGVDIWDNSDAFRFVYQMAGGDCEIKARVTAVGNTDPWAKAGVMVRETLNANSTFALMVITPSNGASAQYRTSTGGSCVADQSAGKTVPYWVRMVRSGNSFTGYMSPDGQTWTQVGASRTITMGTTVHIGLAVTAHNNGLLNTSTLDNVVVGSGAANQPPTANAQSVTTAEDTAKGITLTGSDPEGSTLTYTVVTGPAHGTLTGTGASRTYTPAANYNGADSFTFRVSDGALTSTPATVSITVTAVIDVPTCALTAPANGATYTAPASIAIQATAADVDGTIAKVEFFNGATKLGEDTTSPYAYAWSGVAAGSYTLTARATDNNGATTTSASRSVTVTAVVNQPPVVSFTRPSNGAQFPTDSTVSVTVSAVDPDGTIANVKLYLNGQFVRQENIAPYTWGESGQNDPLLTSMAAGTYTLEAVATDNAGATRSATIQIAVIAANQSPVAMAGVDPSSGAITNEFYFWATDSYDPDGTVTGCEWRISGALVSTNAEFLWTFATGGAYTVTLTVWDDAGASGSDMVVVNVSETVLPVVSVAVSDGTAGEPGLTQGSGRFQVSRSGDLTTAITVNYAMSGTASNGADYTKMSGSVGLAAGKSSVNVTLTPLADALVEGDETAILTLLSRGGYTVNETKLAGTVTIKDQTYGKPVVTAVAMDATAAEPGLTVNKGAIKVSRTGSCHAVLTVKANLGGTSSNGVDYTKVTVPVTLAVGQSVKTLTITPLADGVVESNETVILTILPDAAYDIGAGQGAATATIVDNTQLTTPVVSVVATDSNAAEPTATVVNTGKFTFSRTSRFHEALTVSYTMGGTASNGVDYNTLSGAVTIPAGAVTATATVTPKADGVVEGPETVVLTIKTSAAYTIDGAKGAATVTIMGTAVNNAPTCGLTAPANGATYTAPASITLQATAADADGTIAKVEFFNGAAKLGEDTTSPYAYTWSSVAAGSYTLTAKATDNSGAITTSAGVNITVTAAVNQPPVAHAQSVSTVAGTAKAITLTGSDPEGSTLTYAIIANPAHGTLTGTGASRTYTPAANYSDADSFTFKVNDGALDSAPAIVSITVTVASGLPFPTGWDDPVFNAAATNVKVFISTSQGQVVEDVTLDKGGVSGAPSSCLDVYSDCTVKRVRINAREGVRGAFGNVDVSWLYVQVFANAAAGDHADAWQNYGPGIGPNDTTIYLKNSHLRCSTTPGSNAAFFTGDWMGRIVMEDVWLAGGGYTLYLPANGATSIDLKNVYIEEGSWVYGPLYASSTWPTILRWENVCIARIVNGQIEVVRQIPRPR